MRLTYLVLLIALLAGCAAPAPTPDSPSPAPATAAPQPTPSPNSSYDREALLRDTVEGVILTLQDELAAEARALQAEVEDFQASPEAESLAAVRSQWAATALAYKRAQVVGFGVEMMSYHYAIYRPPARVDFIEEVIAGEEPIDAALVGGFGSTSKGLSAIEYLIYGPDDAALLAGFVAAPRRGAYLLAAAQDVNAQAEALRIYWGASYAEPFITAAEENGDLQRSLDMLVNELISVAETGAQARLGKPMGLSSGGDPRPDETEAALSGLDAAMLAAQLEACEAIFSGGDGEGLDDYLVFLGQGELAASISAQYDAAEAALADIPQPLHQAVAEDPASVQAAYDELAALVVLLKVDLANQLGVTVTFNDSDGD